MKKLMTAALALSLALMSTAAFAQPEPGDAGIFADMAGTETSRAAAAFTPFDFYVVAFDLVGQPNAFEYSLDAPPTMTILSLTLAGPNPGNIGNNTNVIAFTGACVDGSGAWVMATYNVGFFAGDPGTDVALCMGPANPSTFDGLPGYSQCDNTVVPFTVASNGQGIYPDGCFILNPTQDPPVAVEEDTFGEIKARF